MKQPPRPLGADEDEWVAFIKEEVNGRLDDDTILRIAHRICETIENEIVNAIFDAAQEH